MLRVSRTGLTVPAVAGLGSNEGLGVADIAVVALDLGN
jgi:hypothetical protein